MAKAAEIDSFALVIPPGIKKRSTRYEAEGRWFDGDKVRSRDGLPEKLGGWMKRIDSRITGTARGAHSWRSNAGERLLAIGTESKLYVLESTTLTDITPLRDSGSLGTDPFTMVSGSKVVTVADTAHGLSTGDTFISGGATAAHGITINGPYIVGEVPGANTFKITHTAAATSNGTGGGASVTFEYEIPVGNADAIDAFGYGTGPYGDGKYGEKSATALTLDPRVWNLDSFGQDLQACPFPDGAVYDWTPGDARAALLTGTAIPTSNAGLFVTEFRHLVVFGANGNGLEIVNSDEEDNNQFTISDTTTAGSETMQGGNNLIAGGVARFGINLLWSDTSVFTMAFIGGDAVYAYHKLASGGGILGPHAWAELGGKVYWVSDGQFWMYEAGSPRPMRNVEDIRDFFFDRLERQQRLKTFAVANQLFSEIVFFYVSTADPDMEIDSYLIYNTFDHSWWPGTLKRTAGVDRGIFPNPIWVGGDGYFYDHETGRNDDGAPMYSFIESAPADVEDGRFLVDIMGMAPDTANQVGRLDLTLETYEYPQAPVQRDGPVAILPGDQFLDLRGEGRQVAILLESKVVDGDWRLGKPVFNWQLAGRR